MRLRLYLGFARPPRACPPSPAHVPPCRRSCSATAPSTPTGCAAILGVALAATPAGWVLIVGGLVTASFAAGASGLADRAMRDMAAPAYEGLVRWLQERS